MRCMHRCFVSPKFYTRCCIIIVYIQWSTAKGGYRCRCYYRRHNDSYYYFVSAATRLHQTTTNLLHPRPLSHFLSFSLVLNTPATQHQQQQQQQQPIATVRARPFIKWHVLALRRLTFVICICARVALIALINQRLRRVCIRPYLLCCMRSCAVGGKTAKCDFVQAFGERTGWNNNNSETRFHEARFVSSRCNRKFLLLVVDFRKVDVNCDLGEGLFCCLSLLSLQMGKALFLFILHAE